MLFISKQASRKLCSTQLEYTYNVEYMYILYKRLANKFNRDYDAVQL